MKTEPETTPEASITLCLLDCAEYHANRAEEFRSILNNPRQYDREKFEEYERMHRDFATACKMAAACVHT